MEEALDLLDSVDLVERDLCWLWLIFWDRPLRVGLSTSIEEEGVLLVWLLFRESFAGCLKEKFCIFSSSLLGATIRDGGIREAARWPNMWSWRQGSTVWLRDKSSWHVMWHGDLTSECAPCPLLLCTMSYICLKLQGLQQSLKFQKVSRCSVFSSKALWVCPQSSLNGNSLPRHRMLSDIHSQDLRNRWFILRSLFFLFLFSIKFLIVFDHERFAREILLRCFKHQNFPSSVLTLEKSNTGILPMRNFAETYPISFVWLTEKRKLAPAARPWLQKKASSWTVRDLSAHWRLAVTTARHSSKEQRLYFCLSILMMLLSARYGPHDSRSPSMSRGFVMMWV